MDIADYGLWAVDLVNTWDHVTRPRDPATEREAVRAFLAERHPALASSATTADLDGLRALRDALREVFAADSDDDAIAALNTLLAGVRVQPVIARHDDEGWHLHLTPPGVPVLETVRAAVVMGLSSLLLRQGLDHRGVCAHEHCVDVYVDSSRNHTRRFCSTTCLNRANVAAHRARKRAAQDQ